MVADLGTFEWGIIAAELLLMAKEGFFPAQSIQAGMFIKIRAGVQSSSRPAHLSCCSQPGLSFTLSFPTLVLVTRHVGSWEPPT